jgi:hypothetical protein
VIDKFEFWLGIVVISFAIGALFVVDYTYSRNAEDQIIQTCKEAR